MDMDKLGILTVGTLVTKRGGHTLPFNILLAIPPKSRKPLPLTPSPKGHHIRAYPMQHVVNNTLTCWVAANLISGYPAQAVNHRHWSARHNQGRGTAPKAAGVQVFGGLILIEGGH